MSSFREFLVGGEIGQVRLNISMADVIRLLGPPTDWLGKATVIGELCATYDESELWFYYYGSVGVRFDAAGVSDKIILYPDHFAKCAELFKHWAITEHLTMGEWRKALATNCVEFRESDPESSNYWIVAEQACVAFGFPTAGDSGNGYERFVEMISNYSNARTMLDECKFIGLP